MPAHFHSKWLDKVSCVLCRFGVRNIILGLVATWLLGPSTPTSAAPMQFAFVTNSGGNSVSVISPATRQVIDTIVVGMAPTHVAISPNGRRAYVSNRDSHSVSVIDTLSASVVDTIPVGIMPGSLAVSRDGGKVYVTNSGSATVSIINTQTNSVADTISTSIAPSSVAVHPLRDELWIGFSVGSFGTTLEVRSTVDNSILASKDTRFNNYSPLNRLWAGTQLVFREDGTEAFGVEGCGLCGRFHRILGAHAGGLIGIVDQDLLYDNAGTANSVAINPSDGTAYLAKTGQAGPHRVVEFGNLGRTVQLGKAPAGMAVSRDGAFLYVTHGVNPGTISIVDTATFSVVDTMNVGAGPYSIVMAAIDTSGDFNRNGDVDAGDYLTWRKSFGMTVTNGAEADGNRDGVVDASDYIIWRKNLQANSGSDNAHLPVPEPHALTLALLGGIAAIASLRSRDRNY